MAMRWLLDPIQRIFPGFTRENLLAAAAKRSLDRAETPPEVPEGAPIYVAGYFRSHAGIASGARAQLAAFRREGRAAFGIDLTAAMGQAETLPFDGEVYDCRSLPEDGAPGTVVVYQNPRWFLIALARMGRRFLRGKRIVGHWTWELEEIPDWWCESLDYLHEVWVPTRFVRDAVGRHTAKPLKVVPYPETGTLTGKPRPFAADGVLRVLFIFDAGSGFERKNPLAAVEAFRQAFADRSDVELLLKISRPGMYPAGWEALQRAAAGAPNIRLLDAFLKQEELDDLYRKSDIYLSLHRSEGYGLTIFEAIRFGLETVATGWSGNMDFFHGPNCYAVDYRLVPVVDPQRIYPYPEWRWADPDPACAAGFLREIARKHGFAL